MKVLLITLFFLFSAVINAQSFRLSGIVKSSEGEPVVGAKVFLKKNNVGTLSDGEGKFTLIFSESDSLIILASLFQRLAVFISPNDDGSFKAFVLIPREYATSEIIVRERKQNVFGIGKLESVQGTAIYEGKKSEVVLLDDISANLATNNPRQTFAKVAGLNIWESDGAGIQLGIGGRGLSPNRTSNFNVRQNGYDISADALGYPESYYTPPLEAIERIEVVRGAASLQYGTQFGGMLNFVFKRGDEQQVVKVVSRQSVATFGLFNTFNSIGGTVGNLNYYAYLQYKRGDGWRPNSSFDLSNGFVAATFNATEKLALNLDISLMNYLAQQSGGLTDRAFVENPRQSVRPRNWFEVTWQVAALTATYKFSDFTQLNTRTFALISERKSLGNLERINLADEATQNRTMIDGAFQNFGNETRLIHRYALFGNLSTALVGFRLFNGFTRQRQGDADSGSEPNFRFLNPDNLENSDYRFPSRNYSLFAEHIFALSPAFSLTPGARLERIETNSRGYFRTIIRNNAGDVISDTSAFESLARPRIFLLLGIGATYQTKIGVEVYANASQNYRAVNFTDLRVANLNFKVDENIQDESGYSLDFGARGNFQGLLYFDATLFYLKYNNRIGLNTTEPTPVRTNIGDARIFGVETLIELDMLKLIYHQSETSFSIFSNLTVLSAKYVRSDEPAFRNRNVELAPSLNLRTGATLRRKPFQATIQYAFTGKQFSDATNAETFPTAVYGAIPAYSVMDLAFSYKGALFLVETGINNLLDNRYFTRRAESYPGPGIIPSDARSFYLTLGVTF